MSQNNLELSEKTGGFVSAMTKKCRNYGRGRILLLQLKRKKNHSLCSPTAQLKSPCHHRLGCKLLAGQLVQSLIHKEHRGLEELRGRALAPPPPATPPSPPPLPSFPPEGLNSVFTRPGEHKKHTSHTSQKRRRCDTDPCERPGFMELMGGCMGTLPGGSFCLFFW